MTQPEARWLSLGPMFIQQMALGAALGFAMGKLIVIVMNRLSLEFEGLYPVLTLSIILLTYGATAALGGSGFSLFMSPGDVEVPKGSPVIGKQIVVAGFPKGALIVLIGRGEEFIVPNGSTTIALGDRLLMLADEEDLARARAIVEPGDPAKAT